MRPPSLLTIGLTGFIVLGVAASATAVVSQAPADCEIPTTVTTAASLVSVTDSVDGPVPDAFFPTPLKTTGIERLTIREGVGEQAVDTSAVDFQVAVYFGDTGDLITSTSFDYDAPLRRVINAESEDFFERELRCVTSGERLVYSSTIGDVFGAVPEDEIVQNSSSIVLVIDIQQAYMPRPTGRAALPERGMPQVVDHPEGFHGLSFPMAPPPSDLAVQTLIQGSGERVEDGDRVVVHYTGAVWETQSVFAASFDQASPATLTALDGSADDVTTGVIRGVYESIVGQRVGSRVISVIPPEFGYPVGNQPPGVQDGATLVYVFDILGIE